MKKYIVLILLWLICTEAALAGSTNMSVDINIPECTLRVYANGSILYQAPVGIGRPGHESPVGEFTIINKIVNPTWYPKDKEPVPPGPSNPLGHFWLGLSISGYGIHGNISPTTIGTPISSGCIRMHNDDIDFMYRLLERGTKVQIRYQTIGLVGEGKNLQMRIYPDVYNFGTTNVFKFLEVVESHPMKDQIFMPRVITLLNEVKDGTYPLPFKVEFVYNGQSYTSVGYEEGQKIYLDPRAIDGLLGQEELLAQLVVEQKNRYITLEDLRSRLLYHKISLDGPVVRIEHK